MTPMLLLAQDVIENDRVIIVIILFMLKVGAVFNMLNDSGKYSPQTNQDLCEMLQLQVYCIHRTKKMEREKQIRSKMMRKRFS
ncbi:hypothetical protein RIR_jg31183.t1 [Rhizophagus irregularis DAOM 181602=DAOM 197198]|nr:hypothetical protein RIR_jg31183.t1 [Rhizophagus irregularis DAOM 181602=DAOM 197198]